MVQRAVGALGEGDVVRLVTALEEGDDLMAAAVEQLLGEAEAQRLPEEPADLGHLLGVHEDVIEAWRGDPQQPLRVRARVAQREPAADLVDVVDELHLVARRRLEADRCTLADLCAGGDALDGDPVALDTGFERREVVGVLDLEGVAVEPDAGVVADGEAVMVAFVPALEEDAVLRALGDVEADDLRVVGGGELEVRDGDVDVAQAQDPHDVTDVTRPVPHRGMLSRMGERLRRTVADVPSTLSSVSNALRVLKAFTTAHREWGVSDLARHLELGKSTVHRLLSTLVEERMLDQDLGTGRYRLGLAVLDLAAAVPTQLDLHEAVLSPMSELRNRSGETVQVAVLDGRHVVYIERLDSPRTLRMFLEIGRRNHAHSTATGKVLLAHLPERDLDRLLKGWELARVTPHTITDQRALRAELDAVRARGVRREPARVGGRVSSAWRHRSAGPAGRSSPPSAWPVRPTASILTGWRWPTP